MENLPLIYNNNNTQTNTHAHTHTGEGEGKDIGRSDIMFNKVNLTISLLKDSRVPGPV